ncbi:hypothetical protein CWO90_06715 [Bradyrhizobium sp. Leo121]|nr:hypothetical protein CWO90_06715 [Bradyrhizobium sp. Leo121]
MQRLDHDLRYDMAGEFVAIMKSLWRSEQNLTHSGRFWQLEDAFVRPKRRYGRPILVNASGSSAGFSFAARHSDLVFITSPGGAHINRALDVLPELTTSLKAKARSYGRQIRTIINPMIVCRPTEAEARAYYDRILDLADMEARYGLRQSFQERRRCGMEKPRPARSHPRRQRPPDREPAAGGRLADRLEPSWMRGDADLVLRLS